MWNLLNPSFSLIKHLRHNQSSTASVRISLTQWRAARRQRNAEEPPDGRRPPARRCASLQSSCRSASWRIGWTSSAAVGVAGSRTWLCRRVRRWLTAPWWTSRRRPMSPGWRTWKHRAALRRSPCHQFQTAVPEKENFEGISLTKTLSFSYLLRLQSNADVEDLTSWQSTAKILRMDENWWVLGFQNRQWLVVALVASSSTWANDCLIHKPARRKEI